MTHGVVFGKFYPPHRGHKFLIDTALGVCDELSVLVLAHPKETISAAQRARWLQEIHPAADVQFVTTDLETNYDPSAGGTWEAWTNLMGSMLRRPVDFVFTSEEYGDEQARQFTKYFNHPCKHIKLDMDRNSFPVSATMVRANPAKNWWNLEPCVRADLTKRIVLVGAESVGKSTLARNLGLHYNTPVVPEYGRLYSLVKEVTGTGDDWSSDDFMEIVKYHVLEEDELARQAGPVLICDTDPLATSVWHQRYMNREIHDPVHKYALARIRNKTYAHYLLCSDEGTPYVDDGMRIDDGSRPWMTERFRTLLDEQPGPQNYTVISGSWEERYDQAVHAIDGVLWRGWNIGPPGDASD